MITFKKYPPAFIPLRHWTSRVNKKGVVEYLVIPTLLKYAKGISTEEFKNHFGYTK